MSLKEAIETYVNGKASLIEEVNEKIWHYAEVGLEEEQSAAFV